MALIATLALTLAGPAAAGSAETLATAAKPDIASSVELALDLAIPLYGNGKSISPEAFVNYGGVVRNDQELASGEYLLKRMEAIRTAEAAGNPYLPQERRLRYAHCSQFVATVIINTIDPMYPGDLTKNQYPYVMNPNNGWQKVGTSETYTPKDYEPGDVFLTRGAGHTFMWIGQHGEYSDVVAEASYAPERSEQLKLPSLKRYSVDAETGLDSAGRAYDVWRFVGRTGEAEPPDPDDSWNYRNIFSDFDVAVLNQPDPEGQPYLLGPGTSALVASFTLRTPNDAEPGDEFTIESAAPYPFRAFESFPIRADDGTEIATGEYVSRYAVKIVLSEAVANRENITGRVKLTAGASPSADGMRDRQSLTFFGGEQELGPGVFYNISKWSPPKTSLLGSAQLYDEQPGVLTYVVYRFGDERDFDSAKVSMDVRADTVGVALLCGEGVQLRYEWLGSEHAAPIGSGKAVVNQCSDRDNSVTVRLPKGVTPPEEATGVRLRAAWLADQPAESYAFTATLRAPGIDDDDRLTWTKSFRSAALEGAVEVTLIEPKVQRDPVSRALAIANAPLIDGPRLLIWGAGALMLAVLLVWGGFRAGTRRALGSQSIGEN